MLALATGAKHALSCVALVKARFALIGLILKVANGWKLLPGRTKIRIYPGLIGVAHGAW